MDMAKLVETYLKEYTFKDVPEDMPAVAQVDADVLKHIILDCLTYVENTLQKEALKAAPSPSKKLH